MGHRVKTHQWKLGILETVEHSFNSFAEAVRFVKDNGHRNAKIYDESNTLVHAVTNGDVDTYA